MGNKSAALDPIEKKPLIFSSLLRELSFGSFGATLNVAFVRI